MVAPANRSLTGAVRAQSFRSNAPYSRRCPWPHGITPDWSRPRARCVRTPRPSRPSVSHPSSSSRAIVRVDQKVQNLTDCPLPADGFSQWQMSLDLVAIATTSFSSFSFTT